MSKLLIAVILSSSFFVSGCSVIASSVANSSNDDEQIIADTAAAENVDVKDVSVTIFSKGLTGTMYWATIKKGKKLTKYTCSIPLGVPFAKKGPPQCLPIEQPSGASPFH